MSPAGDSAAADVAEVIEARVSTFRAVLTAIAGHGLEARRSGIFDHEGNVGIHARSAAGARAPGDAAVGILADLAPGIEPVRRDLFGNDSSSYTAGGFTVYAELHPEARS